MEKKIAVITGGSRGLGANATLKLAAKGVGLILTYKKDADAANAIVSQAKKTGVQAIALQLDAGKTASFPAFAEKVKEALDKMWKRKEFDFLVNNAGMGVYANFAETTEAQFDELMKYS